MSSPYICRSPRRIEVLRAAAAASPQRLLNGIQYLEVSADQRRLYVHFVHPLDEVPTQPLTPANVEIRGGVRVRDPAVTGVSAQDNVLTVEVATVGDFSRYRLRLVASAGGAAPPEEIDPALAQVEFGFKVDCPSDFDCKLETVCPPQTAHAPAIDYLARDYPSFRRLILDRLSALLPQWRERNPADVWVTVAEAIAYRADELAYFQDAVGTEAYLGSARQRVSVRRHARLLDYPFHDGCNARAWVAFEAKPAADGLTLAGCDPDTGLGGTLLLTAVPGPNPGATLDPGQAQRTLDAGALPFELITPVTLYNAHNAMRFYTWSDDECCLPKGATAAFLRDDEANRLRLRAGDVLVLEAWRSSTTGERVDADSLQRHAVRLTRVDPEAPLAHGVRGVPALHRDPVTGEALVAIEWGEADALPFALCLSKRIRGVLVPDMAGVAGNVALADHGLTAPREDSLTRVAGTRLPRYLLPRTAVAPLTRQCRVRMPGADRAVLVDFGAAASAAMMSDVADARPALAVTGTEDRRAWSVQRDLLASGPESGDFVVETENDGRALLRFGDGVMGRAPQAGETLRARVRTGNGAAGNVGGEAIAHVLAPFEGIERVRNPMPARGGLDPQPLAQARLYAPQAFRHQERAVTAADYAATIEREPSVQRAAATRRWTGSWYTMFVTVDRQGSEAIDPELEAQLAAFIERYRLAGHDVEIDAPRFVALDIELQVCTRAGYFASDVERRLLEAFSARRLPSGADGFFHPDRFTFGQPVYLSALIAAAMAVSGVAHVVPVRFQRLGRSAGREIADGRIAMGRLEIARLDNDPNAPENGRIRFDMVTGAGP